MAITSTRRLINKFETDDGEIDLLSVKEATSSAAPGEVDLVVLSSGANTITPPAGSVAVTILFPAGNTTLVTLKGTTGDTGVVLHPTDPTSVGINDAASTFVLTAATDLSGTRLIWS